MASFIYRKLLRTCVLVYSSGLYRWTALPIIYNDNPLALAHLWDTTFASLRSPYQAMPVIIYFFVLWNSKLSKENKLRIEATILNKKWKQMPGFGGLIKALLCLIAKAPRKVVLLVTLVNL